METTGELDHHAILGRAEEIIDTLRTRHVREGWQGPDELAAERLLQYFRRCAEGVPDDVDEWYAAMSFFKEHGQSLDWILVGDPRGMICQLAAQSPSRNAGELMEPPIGHRVS
jgi:hypothetical protein